MFVYGFILACLTLGSSVIGAWSLFQGTRNNGAWGQKGDLELSMIVDKTVIFAGEYIEFVFTLKNNGDEKMTFWMGPPFFDVYLYDPNDALVAKWTEGRGFPEYIEKIVVKPGENFSETIRWNLYSYNNETGDFIPVEPGQYGISGVWLGEPRIETSKVGTTVKETGGIEGTVTDPEGNPLAGMRICIISGTTFFPEIAVETDEEGYYQIGSIPQGTFEVAVHDRQGNSIGLGSVTVRSGETSTLNFVIQSVPSDVTKFTAVVNEMRSVDVLVHVDISNGLTEEDAELIAEATFIEVMGERVLHQLDTLTFNDTQIKAHYTWGVDENDMGHVFDMTADLTKLLITVAHCR